MRITFLGHAGFQIEGTKTILIDPWLGDNPMAACKAEDIAKADYIVATHDHFDHNADIPALAQRSGANVVAVFETANQAGQAGCQTTPCNLGGPVQLEGCTMVFTPAFHSMSANPSGVVVELDGRTIYHAGDTSVFGDMSLIGELYRPDLALLPIGGHFTMGPREAAKAVELLEVQRVVPMHYDTFPPIKADPEELRQLIGGKAELTVLKPGESLSLD